MTRYLIEVPHQDSKGACDQAIKAFRETGSHFMTNADWGCGDGEHKAWIVVDLASKEQARTILPPLFREDAKIIQLQQFNVDASQETIQKHSD